jgi:hypothetical protein
MIPKIGECKAYIIDCGYHFQYYNRPWYVFKADVTGKEVTFTLGEIRHAYLYGW